LEEGEDNERKMVREILKKLIVSIRNGYKWRRVVYGGEL
jgi:hypothetical protein